MRIARKDYLAKLPKSIERGRVLVHNHVAPGGRLGARGFRAWLQNPDDEPPFERCECGWAPALGEHYRVKRA
jgi:hypothetical protein